MILSCTFNHSPESLSAIKLVFSNLTHLSLVICSVYSRAKYPDSISPDSRPSFYWSRLPEVLRSLQNVTHFSLDLELSGVDLYCLPEKHRDNVAELFHSPFVTFPRLTSLSLANLQTCAPSLLLLLQRHPAIQDLSLRHVLEMRPIRFWISQFPSKISAGWFEVTEAMRALRLQRLELYKVDGLNSMSQSLFHGHGTSETEVMKAKLYAYIQHGYGPNPFGPDRDKVDSWDAELW